MFLTMMLSSGAALSGPASSEKLEICEDYYDGRGGQARDLAKAFECFRRQGNWLWAAVMQLNGEGTPIDVAGARANLNKRESRDADWEALDAIIKKREANPTATGPQVDFCKDIAMTTPSWGSCRAREEDKQIRNSSARRKRIRANLDRRIQVAFDAASATFDKFEEAEGDRAYRLHIGGSARGMLAMDQQARVRRNFMEAVSLLTKGPADRLRGRRTFAEADKELNAVYKANVSSYVKFNEELAVDARREKHDARVNELLAENRDYKAKARAAQQLWIRYRDAMGTLTAARWPSVPDAQDHARTLVTEDRIRELRGN